MQKRQFLGPILMLSMVLPAAVVVSPQSAAGADTCVSGKCHASMGKEKFVHSPVKDKTCTMCHQAAEDPKKKTKHPGNLTITLVQQGAELCGMCHEAKNVKKVVHAPIQGGDCTSCHNPHQSPYKGMLKDKQPELCFQCHPDSLVKNKSVHKPAAAGNCSVCHDNHQSDVPKRLLKDANVLCLGCHPAMDKLLKAGKSVHAAVQQGCPSCHNPHSSPNKALTTAAVPALCEQCHGPKNKKKVVHAPVMGGDCLTCHNPHASANKGMLTAASPKLCFQCHPESLVKHKVVHPPVAAGDCSGCHDNHESDTPHRLVQPGNALCFQCHPDKEEGVKKKKAVHYPVKQSCTQCHNPHGAANAAMLSAPVPQLCANCHPNEAMLGQRAITKHGPMTDAKTCRNCHDAHFSDHPRLLDKPQAELCLSCHDKELDTEKGKIANMKAHLAANKNGHGPVRNGDCVSCHNPHGSDYWRILQKYYPADFYTSYSEGKYALCFSCHDKTAFSERFTSRATKFRDGDKNLHFIHVNKAAKGRTCKACHEPHADNGQQNHVRQTVGFSYWAMPMNFTPNKNGGTCAPGCHGEKKYSWTR